MLDLHLELWFTQNCSRVWQCLTVFPESSNAGLKQASLFILQESSFIRLSDEDPALPDSRAILVSSCSKWRSGIAWLSPKCLTLVCMWVLLVTKSGQADSHIFLSVLKTYSRLYCSCTLIPCYLTSYKSSKSKSRWFHLSHSHFTT